jgi:hypothetical protein
MHINFTIPVCPSLSVRNSSGIAEETFVKYEAGEFYGALMKQQEKHGLCMNTNVGFCDNLKRNSLNISRIQICFRQNLVKIKHKEAEQKT